MKNLTRRFYQQEREHRVLRAHAQQAWYRWVMEGAETPTNRNAKALEEGAKQAMDVLRTMETTQAALHARILQTQQERKDHVNAYQQDMDTWMERRKQLERDLQDASGITERRTIRAALLQVLDDLDREDPNALSLRRSVYPLDVFDRMDATAKEVPLQAQKDAGKEQAGKDAKKKKNEEVAKEVALFRKVDKAIVQGILHLFSFKTMAECVDPTKAAPMRKPEMVAVIEANPSLRSQMPKAPRGMKKEEICTELFRIEEKAYK